MAGKTEKLTAAWGPWLAGGLQPLVPFLKTEKGIAYSLLAIALVFNAVFLWSEAGVPTFYVNDDVVHLTAAREASSVLRQGQNPTDFWLSGMEMGLPLFHYYQNLPHVVLAVLDQVTSLFLPISRVLDISQYLLLVFFPLSIFHAMRRFDFGHTAAGLSAVVAPLLSTNFLYGLDYGSYIWRGFGMYTQLWVVFFLPLALSEVYRTLRRQGSWFLPVFLSSIVLLSHLLYGLMLVVSAALFVFLSPERAEILSRLKRFSLIFLLSGLVTSYFFLPVLLDGTYLYKTIWLEPFKYNSFGAARVLENLVTGNLLDYGRIPVLTALFVLAAFFVLREWRRENCRLVLMVTAVWLLVYFGRPTWGPLLDLVPFGQVITFHRFIGGFHLGAIMILGAGLSLFVQWGERFSLKGLSFGSPLVVGIIFLLLLSPAFLERATFYEQNTRWRTGSQQEFLSKGSELTEIRETLDRLPPGRLYAGLYTDFGNYAYYKIGMVNLYAVFTQLGVDTFGYAYNGFGFTTDTRLHFDNKKPREYDLFNIRYVLLHNTWTPAYYYTKLQEFDDYTLYRVPTTGYFDLVDAPAVFYGNSTGFYGPNSRWLWSPLPDLKEHPILELGARPEDTRGLPVYTFGEVDAAVLSGLQREQPAAGEILQENLSANEYRARFVADRDCYLMLKTNYHPGWRVTLDGREVSPVMLAPGYIGIEVDQGTHQAAFSYRPPFYRFPLMVAGILVLVLLGLMDRGLLPGWIRIPEL